MIWGFQKVAGTCFRLRFPDLTGLDAALVAFADLSSLRVSGFGPNPPNACETTFELQTPSQLSAGLLKPRNPYPRIPTAPRLGGLNLLLGQEWGAHEGFRAAGFGLGLWVIENFLGFQQLSRSLGFEAHRAFSVFFCFFLGGGWVKGGDWGSLRSGFLRFMAQGFPGSGGALPCRLAVAWPSMAGFGVQGNGLLGSWVLPVSCRPPQTSKNPTALNKPPYLGF